MNTKQSPVYDKNTLEFITVSLSLCNLLENAEENSTEEFVSKAIKILPLLYLKGQLLPEVEYISDENVETFVTEEDYEWVKEKIAELLGEYNDYLEVFHPDMPYSDTPILVTISEDLADIYQDLKNLISVFKLGNEVTMNDALVMCKDSFHEYWGQRLLNGLRALHAVSKTF